MTKTDTEILKIIRLSPERTRQMLNSIYNYNSQFITTKKQNKLLEKILFSISIIDRKFFAENRAYEDNALPIGNNQTISQPSTVARMLLLLEPEPYDTILEIGAGSGYNASLLAFLSYPGFVISIDRINNLVKKAQQNIFSLKNYLRDKNPQIMEKLKINLMTENILSPKKIKNKKYSKIIFTAGINKEQESKIQQIAKKFLKQEGKLICPYTSGPILIIDKINGKLKKTHTQEEYVFVPLLEGLKK